MKKFIIFMLMLFALMGIGNSVTVLNSCGKTTGWVSGETYLLNFTEIPAIYGSSFCFGIEENVNNITFTTNNNEIVVKKDMYFIYANNYLYDKDRVKFTDFKIKIDSSITSTLPFIISWQDTSKNADFWEFNNAYIHNWLGLWYKSGNGYINQVKLNGSDIKMNSYIFSAIGSVASMNIYDSLIYSKNNLFSGVGAGNVYNSVIIGETNFKNGAGVNYIGSLLKSFLHTDSDDNGVADSDLYSGITSAKIYIDLFGYRFIQDFEEGSPFIIGSSTIHIPINNEEIGSPDTYQGQTTSIFDTSLITLGFKNQEGLILNNQNSIDCSLISSEKCFLSDTVNFNSVIVSKNRGMIKLNGNDVLIDSLNMTSSIPDNNGQLISNFLDVTRNNLTIQNSYFLKANDRVKTGDSTGNFLLQLKYNNLKIQDNQFILNTANNSITYEVLDIEGTNPQSNIITRNIFEYQNVIPTSYHEIFTNKADTYFYNNKVGVGVIVALSEIINLNVNKLVGFEHTNGNIYYYNLGNFYSEYSCIDSDSNGICDSPYISGGVTDNYPLSSYPFDYTAHLLTADQIVIPSAYDITLYNITDNQTINIADTNTPIPFGFSENSDYPDLTCDYIIDGVTVYSEDVVLQNEIYSQSFTGWINKTYSYRVDCYNEFDYSVSTEINFDVIVGTNGGTNGGTNQTGDNVFGSVSDIITEDVGETSDNIVGFIGSLSNGVLNILIPVGLFLFVVLMIAGTMALIGGR